MELEGSMQKEWDGTQFEALWYPTVKEEMHLKNTGQSGQVNSKNYDENQFRTVPLMPTSNVWAT